MIFFWHRESHFLFSLTNVFTIPILTVTGVTVSDQYTVSLVLCTCTGSSSKDAPFVGPRVIYQADEQLYISIGN